MRRKNTIVFAAGLALLMGFAASAKGQGRPSIGSIQPPPTLSPDKLLFQCVVGQPCPGKTTTLTNVATIPIGVTSITISGNFSQTNNCRSLLGPGGSCSISLAITDSEPGTFTGVLRVNGNSLPPFTQTALLKAVVKKQGL